MKSIKIYTEKVTSFFLFSYLPTVFIVFGQYLPEIFKLLILYYIYSCSRDMQGLTAESKKYCRPSILLHRRNLTKTPNVQADLNLVTEWYPRRRI
jgi:hypothetical protein